MSAERRVVVDTGVLVSAAIFPRSVPRQAADAVAKSSRLLLSTATFDELFDVLFRPKFDRYVSRLRRIEFLLEVLAAAERVAIGERFMACRDPNDDKFLELAVSGHAECIISGDADLLALHPFRGIEIVTPSDFLAALPQ